MRPLLDSEGKIRLQDSIDLALKSGAILDLDGKEWDYREPVTAKGDLRMRNGKLIYSGGGIGRELVAFQIDGTPELVDFSLYRNGGIDIIGMDINDAVAATLVRCRFDRFRNGNSVGLRLSGVQMAHMSMLRFWENDTHLHVRDGRTVSTDIRMSMPRMTTAICSNGAPAVKLERVGNLSVWGGSIENARNGNLVHASACKGMSFRSTRFEGVGRLTPGKYSHIYLADGCEMPVVDDCSFDNTYPDSGIYAPIIGSDGTELWLRTRDCRFPQTSPTVRDGARATDSGSNNFSGDRLAGLREMFA